MNLMSLAPAEAVLGWGPDSAVKPLPQLLQVGCAGSAGCCPPGQQGLWVTAGSMQAARSVPQDHCERAHPTCRDIPVMVATQGRGVDVSASPWAELC